MFRTSKAFKSIVTLALLATVAFVVFRYWGASKTPLHDGPVVQFPDSMSLSEKEQFLSGNFTIIKDVKSLPRPIVRVFTEEGGTRLILADPGQEFLATDLIYDSSIPSRRLIFAGVLEDKCFVHYEQGGIAHSYLLAFFRVTGNDKMEPVWQDYCGPATDVKDLRSEILKGECSGPPPDAIPPGMKRPSGPG